MKQYDYFVSYQYITLDGQYGFGQVELTLVKQIKNAENINEIRKHLTEKYSFQGVVIINFLLLQEKEV